MATQGNPTEPTGQDLRPTIGLTDEGFPIKDPQELQEQERKRAQKDGREERPVGKEHLDAGASGALQADPNNDPKNLDASVDNTVGKGSPTGTQPKKGTESQPTFPGAQTGGVPTSSKDLSNSETNTRDQATDSTPFVDPEARRVNDGTTKVPTEEQPTLASNTGTPQDPQPKQSERTPSGLQGDLKRL